MNRKRRSEKQRLDSPVPAILSGVFQSHHEERAAIARELNDEVGQMIVCFEHRMAKIQRNTGAAVPVLLQELEDLKAQAREIAEQVRVLALRLHPSTLDHLALAPALRELTRQVGSDYSLRTTFVSRGMPPAISPHVSAVLYRITQESLRQMAKGGGKPGVKVSVIGSKKTLKLRIKAPGIRNSENAAAFAAASEQVRLIGATFSIDASGDHEVQITVAVPS